MMKHHATSRRAALLATRALTAVAGLGLVASIALLVAPAQRAFAAAIDAGPATIITPITGPGTGQPLDSGASATAFSLSLPSGAACTGDSANAGYRVQSYMVPASVNPSSLRFDSQGPTPQDLGASFRQALFDTTSSPFVNAQAADATNPGGPGPIVNIPAFDFKVYSPGKVPAGTYNVGIACTLGSASATQLDRFWNVQIVVATSATDQPAGITWTVLQEDPGTTTSSTSTTIDGSTTSTTTDTSSTSTSSTLLSSSSATTDPPGGGFQQLSNSIDPPATGGGNPVSSPLMERLAALPVTGSAGTSLAVWSVLLLIFGRMAVLLGRPPRVRLAAGLG